MLRWTKSNDKSMVENLGTQMQGASGTDDLTVDDIVSVGNERPPQEPQTEPPAEQTSQQNGQPPQEPASQEPTYTPPPEGSEGQLSDPPPQSPEGQEPPAPQTQEPQTPSAPETSTQTDPWEPVLSTLSNKLGVQYDQEQLVNDLAAFQQFKKDPFGNLPVEIKAHAEFINSGGSTQEFYRLKSLDFQNMSDREVLFQSYLRDHPEHAANMDFARMDFDRNYNSTYGLLQGPKKTIMDFTDEDDEVDHQAWNQYQQDYEYWKQKQNVESGIARSKLMQWQEQATTPQHPDTGLTQEEAQAYQQQHLQVANQIKTSYKGEVFPISDKPEESLNLGLSDSIRPQWEKDLENPMPLFNELGLMNDGKLDMDKFKRTAFIHRMWPQLGKIVSKLILEQNTRQTVTGQQVNPTQQVPPSSTSPPGEAHGDDEMAEVAEIAYQQELQRRRQSRGYTG
jgi:hypothetical protein